MYKLYSTISILLLTSRRVQIVKHNYREVSKLSLYCLVKYGYNFTLYQGQTLVTEYNHYKQSADYQQVLINCSNLLTLLMNHYNCPQEHSDLCWTTIQCYFVSFSWSFARIKLLFQVLRQIENLYEVFGLCRHWAFSKFVLNHWESISIFSIESFLTPDPFFF